MASSSGLRRDNEVDKWLHVDVSLQHAERRARLSVSGQLDVLSAPELITSIIGLLRQVSVVELDLSAVTFLDTAGIRCLLACRNAARAAGLTLRIVDPGPDVARALSITGLLESFVVRRPMEDLSP